VSSYQLLDIALHRQGSCPGRVVPLCTVRLCRIEVMNQTYVVVMAIDNIDTTEMSFFLLSLCCDRRSACTGWSFSHADT
jgi:hypothetical protein